MTLERALEKLADANTRIAELESIIRELVAAVDEQQAELDPSNRLVFALRDAKSWIQR